MLAPDRATLRAVEAHARALCICDGECFETRHGMMHGPCEAQIAESVRALAAYHAALGETARVTRVERCAAVERAAKEAGDG